MKGEQLSVRRKKVPTQRVRILVPASCRVLTSTRLVYNLEQATLRRGVIRSERVPPKSVLTQVVAVNVDSYGGFRQYLHILQAMKDLTAVTGNCRKRTFVA